MLLAIGTALWLGILTSISPCPLATNIAAISFIGKRVDSSRHVLLSGLLYTLGRMIAYTLVGIIVVAGILNIPGLSQFLQNDMNRILGPVLILVGLVLLGLLKLSWITGGVSSDRARSAAEKGGLWEAAILGFLFALSFCPISAGLFFGSLIPLAVGVGSVLVFPSVYGIGTGLPVIVFAFLFAFSTQAVGRAYNKLRQIETWMRWITGIIFSLVGIYYTITCTFGIMI